MERVGAGRPLCVTCTGLCQCSTAGAVVALGDSGGGGGGGSTAELDNSKAGRSEVAYSFAVYHLITDIHHGPSTYPTFLSQSACPHIADLVDDARCITPGSKFETIGSETLRPKHPCWLVNNCNSRWMVFFSVVP